MPTGLETYTDDGYLQLSDSQVYFRLEQKITLPAGIEGWKQWGGGQGVMGAYKDVPITAIPSPYVSMIALSGAGGNWKWVNSSTIRVYRQYNGGEVTVYVFSTRPPPDANGYFTLFNSSGDCVFNSSYPIARPLGIYTASAGYSGVPVSGRTLAHVPQSQQTSQFSQFPVGALGTCTYYNGNPAYQIYNTTGWSEGVVYAGANGSLSSDILSSVVGPIPYMCSPSAASAPQGSSSSQGETRSLIIDVSNI